MAADLLSDLVSKKMAPYVIWTLVFLACAIYFWLSRGPPGEGGSSEVGGGQSASKGRRKRAVSVGLDGTLLGASTPGATAAVNEAAVAPFLKLCSSADVFTVALAENDEREQEVLRTLEALGAFSSGLKRHRVMFSTTDTGRASMIRQLQPSLHVEAAKSVADALENKVPEVRLVGSTEWPTFADGACLGAPRG